VAAAPPPAAAPPAAVAVVVAGNVVAHGTTSAVALVSKSLASLCFATVIAFLGTYSAHSPRRAE